MGTTTDREEPQVEPRFQAPSEELPDWMKLPRRNLVHVAAIGMVFWYLTMIPLWHTDVWLHMKYGEWIVRNVQVPQTELFMPLSEGIRYIDYAWLSQVLFHAVFSAAGFDGLSLLYAATLTAIVALLVAAALHTTERAWLGGVCILLMIPLLWTNFMAFRPQLFGALLFAALLHAALIRNWHAVNWMAIPLGFALWVNLHSSFALGLVVLVCCVLGRAVDAWRQSGRVGSVLGDLETRRWLLVTQLAISASLLNPYGFELFRAILAFGGNPNLQDIVEWQPLSVRSWDGVGMALSVVLLTALLRVSRRPVAATEALLLLVFGLACLPHTRYTQWWGLLMPFVLVPHAGSLLDQTFGRRIANSPRHFKYSVLAVALGWIFFAFSGAGSALLHNRPRKLETVVSRFTPIATAEYLKQHPPQGLVFNPLEWGDWLTVFGPPNLQCLVTSHVHLVPAEVWRAYQRVIELRSGWEATLDGLGATVMVIDKERQAGLWSAVRSSGHWRVVHEDRLGAVVEHVHTESEPAAETAESADDCVDRSSQVAEAQS